MSLRSASLVVPRPAQVRVLWTRPAGVGAVRVESIAVVDQHVAHMAVLEGAERQGPFAGHLEPVGAVPLGQAEQAQSRAAPCRGAGATGWRWCRCASARPGTGAGSARAVQGLWPWLGSSRALARQLSHGERLWRRKSSRTRAAQGLWHQWQRHTGKVAAGEDVLPVVMVVHDWAVDAGAGIAATGIGDGTASTASDGCNGEP